MAALDAYLTDRAHRAGLGSPAQLTAPLLATATGAAAARAPGGAGVGDGAALARTDRLSDVPAGPQPAHWYERNNKPSTTASGALTLKYTYRTQVRRASSPASAIQTGNSTSSVRGQP